MAVMNETHPRRSPEKNSNLEIWPALPSPPLPQGLSLYGLVTRQSLLRPQFVTLAIRTPQEPKEAGETSHRPGLPNSAFKRRRLQAACLLTWSILSCLLCLSCAPAQ